MGSSYREVGKAGSGVFERAARNLTYRFRIDPNSLAGLHRPDVPHFHLEILDQRRIVRVNNHIPFINR